MGKDITQTFDENVKDEFERGSSTPAGSNLSLHQWGEESLQWEKRVVDLWSRSIWGPEQILRFDFSRI